MATSTGHLTSTVTDTVTSYITLPVQIPLTTTFVPPSTCLEPTFTISPAGYDYRHGLALVRGLDPRCFPPGFVATTAVSAPSTGSVTELPTAASSPSSSVTRYQTAGSVQTQVFVTSTAVVSATITQITFSGAGCPAAYTPAHSTSTLVTCCPSSMSPSVPAASGGLQPAISCVALSQEVTITQNASLPISTPRTSLISTIWAPAILVQTSATHSATSVPAPEKHGLSSGAKVGIGVGVGVGIGGLLLALLLAFFLLRRRRSKQSVAELDDTEKPQFEKAELPDSSKPLTELNAGMTAYAKVRPASLEEPVELPAGEGPEELPVQETTLMRAELEGSNVPEKLASVPEPGDSSKK